MSKPKPKTQEGSSKIKRPVSKKKKEVQQEQSFATRYFGSTWRMMTYIAGICSALVHIFTIRKK